MRRIASFFLKLIGKMGSNTTEKREIPMYGKEALLKRIAQLIATAEKIRAAAERKSDWAEMARMDCVLTDGISKLEKQSATFCK